MSTQYYANRILSWPDGNTFVEVSEGIDSADPGVMSIEYPAWWEGWAFDDPVEAVKAGIGLLKAWRKDKPKLEIWITANGMIAGAVGVPAPDNMSEDDVMAWAQKRKDAMPKCDYCGEIIGEITYYNYDFPSEDRYDAEFCAEQAYSEWITDNDEEE